MISHLFDTKKIMSMIIIRMWNESDFVFLGETKANEQIFQAFRKYYLQVFQHFSKFRIHALD